MKNNLQKILKFNIGRKHPDLNQAEATTYGNFIIPNTDIIGIFEGMIGNQLDAIISTMTYMWALLVIAPTGRGKTTLVKKIIKFLRKNHGRMLYVSNRMANSVAFKIDLARRLELFDVVKELQKLRDNGDLNAISAFTDIGPVTIMTYQAAIKKFGINFVNAGENKYDWLVMDEINFFVTDSTFNATSMACLEFIVPKFANACRLYLSATPEAVLADIAEVEKKVLKMNLCNFDKKSFLATYGITADEIIKWISSNVNGITAPEPYFMTADEKWDWLRRINTASTDYIFLYLQQTHPELALSWPTNLYWPDQEIRQLIPTENGYDISVMQTNYYQEGFKRHGLQIAVFEKKESMYNLFFLENNGKLANTIAKIVNSRPADEKAIVFVNSESVGAEAAKLQKNGKSIVLSRTLVDKDGSRARRVFLDIVFNERFDSEIDVVYTTKILDTGTNINDKSVKLVVIALTDPVDVIQCIGRVRTHEYGQDERLNVVFIIPSIIAAKNNIRTLRSKLYNVSNYAESVYSVGETLVSELAESAFLYGNRTASFTEDEKFILDDIKTFGGTSDYLSQLSECVVQNTEWKFYYNYFANQYILNQLYMYSEITGMSLTGDSMDFDPDLPIDKNSYADTWKSYVLGYLSPATTGSADELLRAWGTSFAEIEAEKAREKDEAINQFKTELRTKMDEFYAEKSKTSKTFQDNDCECISLNSTDAVVKLVEDLLKEYPKSEIREKFTSFGKNNANKVLEEYTSYTVTGTNNIKLCKSK